MAWTKEQQEIIDARNCNLLVSAAAGSGKTAVLVERIVQMVLDEKNPIDLDEMLVVTFTKAAAYQMKERIETKLSQELEKQPANEHLLRQLSLIHRAKITTIHSFCMDTVKNYFYKLSLDPNFRIGEEGEISLLKQEVLQEILEEYYGESSEEFLDFVESYAPGKSDKAIEELILKIYEFCISSPRPKRWLDKAKEEFLIETEEELEKTDWLKNLMENVSLQLCELAEKLHYALSLLPEELQKFREILSAEYGLLKQAMEAKTYTEVKTVLDAAVFKRWPILTKKEKEQGFAAEDIAEAKEIRDFAKKALLELRERFFFYDLEEHLSQMGLESKKVVTMIEIVLKFYESFQEKKREKNVFEFHDLEHFTLELLVEDYEGETDLSLRAKPSEIALELRRQYKEIFIDEYQDSNMVQELLLTSISKEQEEGNLFMVGDMKQSIYKFRMARPEIFQNKYRRYQGERDKKVELRNNFRSRREVLESANFLFFQTMQQAFANMSYGEENKLVPSKKFENWNGEKNKTELLLLNLAKEAEFPKEDLEDETDSDYGKAELEAKMVAKKIKQLLSEEEAFFVEDEEGQKRKASYKDIVILLRAISGNAQVFEEVLTDEGIPVHLDSVKGSFHAVEIKTAVSLLEIIDNVYLDIPLVAVLRSPIVAVSAEELAMIRNLVVHEKRSNYSFYEYLKFYLETGQDEELKQKLSAFLNILAKLREEKTYLSIEDLIWSAFEKTGYYQYVKGMPLGKRRQANLDMLMQRAAKYEETSYRGLFQFIRYVRQLNNYEEEFGTAAGLVEDDAVRIMSIHKSKGLEFPIVFVSMLSKQFNCMDINQKLVLHQDYYIGVDKVDIVKREKSPTLKKRFLQGELRLEMLQEELRVLYVALTRAKEKLILTASIKELEPYVKKPFGDRKFRERGLSYLTMVRAKSYLDWIFPALCNEQSTDEIFRLCGVEKGESLYYTQEKEALFDIKILSPMEVVESELTKQVLERMTREELLRKNWQGLPEEKEKIYSEFSYVYPNQAAIEARGKWSVSELKRQLPREDEDEQAEQLISWEELEESKEEEFVPTLPSFLREKQELVATAKGTAVHKVLELLDFDRLEDRERFEQELDLLFESGRIDEREWEAAKRSNLYSLWRTQLGERLRKAAKQDRIYKERQFMIGVPMREIESDKDSDELVLLQGIIDLYFEEEDGIVIIDYKTDYIPMGEEDAWVEKYKAQVLYYKKALEQITGKKVKETYLYAFSRRALFEIS